MTVAQLIKALQKANPKATVWISDEQGGGGEANSPWVIEEPDEFYSGETPKVGDVMISYENT